jgi:hypothetical protein
MAPWPLPPMSNDYNNYLPHRSSSVELTSSSKNSLMDAFPMNAGVLPQRLDTTKRIHPFDVGESNPSKRTRPDSVNMSRGRSPTGMNAISYATPQLMQQNESNFELEPAWTPRGFQINQLSEGYSSNVGSRTSQMSHVRYPAISIDANSRRGEVGEATWRSAAGPYIGYSPQFEESTALPNHQYEHKFQVGKQSEDIPGNQRRQSPRTQLGDAMEDLGVPSSFACSRGHRHESWPRSGMLTILKCETHCQFCGKGLKTAAHLRKVS